MIRPAAQPIQRHLLRAVITLIVIGICGKLLWDRIAIMDMAAIIDAVQQVTLTAWALAAVFTWLSFFTIGQYDAVWHRLLKTGLSAPLARRSGMRAISIAQFLGFGAITGSLIRWRVLPQLSLWQVSQLSFAVTLTFTACWIAFGTWGMYALGAIPFIGPVAAFAVLLILAEILRQNFMPDMQRSDIFQLIILCALDMLWAGLALAVLVPAGTDIALSLIIAAYVCALGVGLISNAPGGAGAFELTLLTLLPLASPEPLVAAMIAFRLVYYVLPAAIGLFSLAYPAVRAQGSVKRGRFDLATQSGEIIPVGGQDWLIGRTGPFTVSLGPQKMSADALKLFKRYANRRVNIPALYNCDGRMALQARKLGWHVKQIAIEAMVRPQAWSIAGAKRQTLRRKLRLAEKAGITIRPMSHQHDLPQMTRIAAAWAVSHGGQLGFSMGRYEPHYVSQQAVFLIEKQGELIGFVTFHKGDDGWVLDLIRHMDNLPDGGIYAAIVAGIAAAKAADVTSLSLASVPDPRTTPAFWADRKAGLAQFKRCFGPIWVPRYLATPNPIAFWCSVIFIGHAVCRPLQNLPWKLRQWANLRKIRRQVTSFRIAVTGQT